MDILTMVMWGVVLIAVGLRVRLALSIMFLPFQVRIREMTSSGVRLIHDTPAKIKKDEDGIEFLRLSKKIGEIKDIPIPPQQAIDYNPKKKKKIVEAWYSEEDGITYVRDEGKIKGFEPFTTKQRQLMVNQLHKKESRKTANWKENIPLIVGVTALVLIIAVVLIFWGDAIAPIQEAAGVSNAALDKADQLWERIIAFEQGRQIIPSETPP